ncbi:hypothetical protein CLCR_06249 [Cladophialophora carrionii]|uniref:Uncharacterized protein n=1 Tax=Cladophialophora carrionii TaxID=86049 RepID=A0A1C1C7Z6_9EURO|nr:hypothetical protein CLCR_06249 [Cladophialophora carrionii]
MDMYAKPLRTLVKVLKNAGVDCEYFFANAVEKLTQVEDIEVCVSSSKLSSAEQALDSSPLFQRVPPSSPDTHAEYTRECPRFVEKYADEPQIVLLSDEEIEKPDALGREDHGRDVYYSLEILDYLTVEDITQTPIPTLPSLLCYLCLLSFSSGDPVHRTRMEQLVDGMNIDKEWCKENLPDHLHAQYVMNLVDGKRDRMGDSSGNFVTRYIAAQQMAESVTRIPGYRI